MYAVLTILSTATLQFCLANEFINLFGSSDNHQLNSEAILQQNQYQKCRENGRDGECVPYWLCSNSSVIKEHGQGVIMERIKDDIKCENQIGKCCFLEDILSPVPNSRREDQPTVSPEIEKQVFGTPPPPVVQNGYPNCRLHDRDGECVPTYLCSSNFVIKEHGEDVLQPRVKEDLKCASSTDICCFFANQSSSIKGQTQTGCGYRNSQGLGSRIKDVQMMDSEYGEFPWMAAIISEEEEKGNKFEIYRCGGSLIHPQVVLTAAHCIVKIATERLKVRLGEWDTKTRNEKYPHVEISVIQKIIHKGYNASTLFNDIGLLILTKSAPSTPNIATICLPPPGAKFDGSRCTASGWGKDKFDKSGLNQVILKKIDLPVVPSPTCQAVYRFTAVGYHFKLHESFMCAGGEPGKDTCLGDGGSPLICPMQQDNSRYYQAGIVSWGLSCGETGIPGVYANVAHLRDWIDLQLQEEGFNSTFYSIKAVKT